MSGRDSRSESAGGRLFRPDDGWRRRLARAGEEATAEYYLAQGGQIIARNWRAGRYAEIDLIVRLAGTLVFSEVKTRSKHPGDSGFAVTGFEAIHRRKQQKLVTSARIYLARHRCVDVPWRVDLVVVEYCLRPDERQRPTLPEPRIIQVSDALWC